MKLAASIICYTARHVGLMPVLKTVLVQDFQEPWEFVLVDALWYERNETVTALLQARPDLQFTHVPPLRPLNRDYYAPDDIPLFQHTGWAYARGEVIVQIEDFMHAQSDWLRTHVEFTRAHPNLVALGDVFDDGTNRAHHGHQCCAETLTLWLERFGDLQHVFANPRRFECTNAPAYGYWVSGNTSMMLTSMLRGNPFPERPTHWPESLNMCRLLDPAGLSMWPLTTAPAWHIPHGIGTYLHGIRHSPRIDWSTELVQIRDFTGDAQMRDIVAERKRLDRWIA